MFKKNPNMNLKAHQLDIDELIAHVKSSKNGLSLKEAEIRLAKNGSNELPPPKKKSLFKRLAEQFDNMLIYVLLGAGVITALLQDWLDTGIIFGVVIINALIGFVQEGKAEKALDSIRNMLSSKALVIRNGRKKEILAKDLVVGDVVFIKSGDKVPADMRLFDTNELKIEEAILTGESLAVKKSTDKIEKDCLPAEQKNMAFSGTYVSHGRGLGIVSSIGKQTELGKINEMLTSFDKETTPLIQKMNEFGKILTIGILALSAVIFAIGYFLHDYSLPELFASAIGLAVAAIPEGLPAIMTITLALGVQKMAKKNAIIRKLPSVETLGSVTVICSDKTGTLTKNEMTVNTVVTPRKHFNIEGVGYNIHGHFDKNALENEDFIKLVQVFDACNDTQIDTDAKGWVQFQGEPTEAALKILAAKAQISTDNFKRLDIIPFESFHKYMAVLVENEDGKFVFLKGAPEKVLELCSNTNHDFDLKQFHDEVNNMAASGKRVIAAAYKKVTDDLLKVEHSDLQNDLVFLGLAGMIDPPREEAIKAVASCNNAGIQVKMITGDHILTATSIAKMLNIKDASNSLNGNEIQEMSDHTLAERIKSHSVFARTTPEHKLRLVKAFQQNGEIVAMTGDGVNDAPALKKANVGIAMGIKGTEVTKESAEMVLTDDNFASITQAVLEGRTIFDNIRKAILFILPTNGAEAFVIITSMIVGGIMPITAAQILWINMVTAITLAIALSFEPSEDGVMYRKPRKPNAPILDAYLIWRISFVSILLGSVVLFLHRKAMIDYGDVAIAGSIAVNALVIGEAFYLLNCRNIHKSVFNRNFFANMNIFYAIGTLLIIQLLYTYTPLFQKIFNSYPLEFYHWGYAAAGGLAIFVIVEIEKLIVSKFFSND